MTRLFVRHPVSTWMVFAAFVVLGIYALPRLDIEAIPDVSLPRLSVVTAWNGASPQAVQRSLTLPIEAAARQVHGVESITSRSSAGQSLIEVEFRRRTDLDFARLELNEQLGAVRRDLPAGASQPQIQAFVPEEFRTEQFFSVNLESSLGTNELRERAELWVVPRLLAVEGVADAAVQGGARPLLRIVLDRRLLDLYGIPAETVFSALDELDGLAGAGVVAAAGLERTVSLRTSVDLLSLEQSAVARSGGRVFRLGELAQIEPGFEDPLYFVRANGQNVVQIAVEKRSGANSVAVSQALRKALPAIEAELPFDVSFYVGTDEGQDLEDKLRELVVRSLAILGLLFILLVASLREVRLTAIVIASILFAIVISLSLFYFLGISVNFITISGLTVCFGLILDNSILVLDAIGRRVENWRRSGVRVRSAAEGAAIATEVVVGGTREVTFPIMATTLTTVVAFVSFIFLSGRLSLYYVPLAVAVATAMAASLFVAFAWLPVVLDQRWARSLSAQDSRPPDSAAISTRSQQAASGMPAAAETPTPADARALELAVAETSVPTEIGPSAAHRTFEAPVDLLAPPRGLERFFCGLQRRWWLVVPALLALFVWSGWIYEKKVLKGGFWQVPNQEELFLYLQLPEGTDVAVTSATLERFEQPLLPIPEGARMQAQAFGHQGFIRVEFEDELLASHYPLLYRELLTEEADRTGGSGVFIRGFSAQPYFKGDFGGAGLNSLIEITGYNSKNLMEIAETTLARVDRNRRVRNARISTTSGFGSGNQEEAVVHIRRDALAAHDLGLLEVIGEVRRILGVDTPWRMFIDGDREQVQLVYEDSESIEFADLTDRVLLTPSGEQVRIGELIAVGMERSPGDITRENQKYSVQVNWEFVGTEKMRSSYLAEILDGIDLPYGYAAKEAQQQFFTQTEEDELGLMIVLATVFIFMVMAALFESLTLPLLVMLSLPMAMVGVVLLFWQASANFDSSARIGLVLLFGVVVNNAILLVARYRSEAEAILRDRFGHDLLAVRSLLPGFRKQLGGSDLGMLPAEERLDALHRAVARGTRIKMRSILLTTGTTIIGLLPLLPVSDRFARWLPESIAPYFAAQAGEGNDIWVNLALSSIGGLTSSLVLILVAVPVLYSSSVRLGWDPRVIWGLRFGGAFGLLAGTLEAARRLSLQPSDLPRGPLPEVVSGPLIGELPPLLFVLGLVVAFVVQRRRALRVRVRDGLVLGAVYSVAAAGLHLTLSDLSFRILGEADLAELAGRTATLFERLGSTAWLPRLVVPETVLLLAAGLLLSAFLAPILRKRGAMPIVPESHEPTDPVSTNAR